MVICQFLNAFKEGSGIGAGQLVVYLDKIRLVIKITAIAYFCQLFELVIEELVLQRVPEAGDLFPGHRRNAHVLQE